MSNLAIFIIELLPATWNERPGFLVDMDGDGEEE
jgi:hypothetical protein